MPSSRAIADDSLVQAKRALRLTARDRRRRRLEGLDRGQAAKAALANLQASGWLSGRAAVAAFWPMAEEFDARPILRTLHDQGHVCLLPCVAGRGRPLIFRLWQPDTELIEEGFGVMTPPPDAPERRPDLLLVPLLAFDAAGYRLGYGAGYYDRTLNALRSDGGPRPLAIGLAFAWQEVRQVPRGPGDARLDGLVSEAGARRFGAEEGQ